MAADPTFEEGNTLGPWIEVDVITEGAPLPVQKTALPVERIILVKQDSVTCTLLIDRGGGNSSPLHLRVDHTYSKIVSLIMQASRNHARNAIPAVERTSVAVVTQ